MSVPEVTEPEEAVREIELAVLSAVAHGKGPSGLAVVKAALVALSRLDREHAAVYFQMLWNGLRAPMRQALEAMVMERQTGGTEKILPFMEHFFELGRREGERKAQREAELKGLREGDRPRIQTCEDTATLDRWIENVLTAKTAADLLS